MNSEYGRKSLEEYKRETAALTKAAAQVEPSVTLTEQNFKALIALTDKQNEWLSIQSQKLERLMTEEDMRTEMQIQTAELTRMYQNQLTDMRTISSSMREENVNMFTQVGRMREAVSQFLDEQKKRMTKYMMRLLLISMTANSICLLMVLILRLVS